MLRITTNKLRRAWSLALALRNRGDLRNPGKIHRLLVARTAQKSTNSRKEIECPKCKQIIDYLFSPLRTHDEIRRIQAIILKDIRRLHKSIGDKRKEEKRPEYLFGRAVQCERCTRLISAIFGEGKSLESGKITRRKALVAEDVKLLSTTAKQTEEQLAQKVELIEETPLVEAEKPKVTGFNTPPRVLGQKVEYTCRSPDVTNNTGTVVRKKLRHNLEKMVRRLESAEILNKMTPIKYGVVNFASVSSDRGGKSCDSSGGDNQNTYDSIAKRFLGIPNSQIDASLIAEMKRLGIPSGSKNSQKPSEKIELEARKCNHEFLTGSNDETSTRKVGTWRFDKTAKPDTVITLQAEGIRFTEETTANEQNHVAYPSDCTKENKFKPPAQKSTELERHKLYSPDSSTFPCHLSPFTETNSYYYYPSIGRQPSNNSSLRHETYGFTYNDKPLYDPHKPIINSDAQKNMNYYTDLYGNSQLKNDTLQHKANEIKSDQHQTTESYIDKIPTNIYNADANLQIIPSVTKNVSHCDEHIANNIKESGGTTNSPLSYTFESKNHIHEKDGDEQVSKKLIKPESLTLSPNLNASIATQPDKQDLSSDKQLMEPEVTKTTQELDSPFIKTDTSLSGTKHIKKVFNEKYHQNNIDSYTYYHGNEPLKNVTILHKESENIKAQQTKAPENITNQQVNAEHYDNKHLQDNTIQNCKPEIFRREHYMIKNPTEIADTAKLYAEKSSINKELKSPEVFISNADENAASNPKDSNYTPDAFDMVEAQNKLQINKLEFKTDTDKRQIYDSHKPLLGPNSQFSDEPLKNVTIEIRETPDLSENFPQNITDTDRRQIYDAHKPILDPNVIYEGNELHKNVTIESKENEMAVTSYPKISHSQMFYQPNSRSHSFIQTPFYFQHNDPFSGQWTDMQHYHMANVEDFKRNIPSTYINENYMLRNQHVNYPVTETPYYHRSDPFSENMTDHQHVWPSILDKSAPSANLEYIGANQPIPEAGNSERHYVPENAENTEATQSAVETRSIEQLQGALYFPQTKNKHTRLHSPEQQPRFPYQLPESNWMDFPYSQGQMTYKKNYQHYVENECEGLPTETQQQEPPDNTLHYEGVESEGLPSKFSNFEQPQNPQMFSNYLEENPYLQGQPFVYQHNMTTQYEGDESEGFSSEVCNAYQRPTLPHEVSNPWMDHCPYVYENTPLYQQNYLPYEEMEQASQPEYYNSSQNPQEKSMHVNPQVIDGSSMYCTDQYSNVTEPMKQEFKEVTEKSPHYAMARPVEQIQGALYTMGENKEVDEHGQESLELPHKNDPWKNQYLNAQNLNGYSPQTYTQQESPKPLTNHNTTGYKTDVVDSIDEHGNSPIETWDAKLTSGKYPGIGPQWMLNPKIQNQEAQQHLSQNPYYYHQSFTYYGYPDQQHPILWNSSNPAIQTSYEVEIFQPTQDKPESQNRASNNLAAEQKTPLQATDIRPDLSRRKGPKSSPPLGPTAAFVSLPQEQWRNETSINLSPKEEPLFEDTVNPKQNDESVPLSEVLREVRKRTRQEFLAKWAQIDVEGKCKRKRPKCPPPTPVCPKEAPHPPPPCPPPPPPCPRPCKPRCPTPCIPQRAPCPPKRAPSCPPPAPKGPICNFESMSLGDAFCHILTQLWKFGITSIVHRLPIFNQRSLPHPEEYTTKAIMTEDVVTQLRLLGDNLFTTCSSDLGRHSLRMETLTLVRGFEPWVPLPSWPIPVEEKEKPFVCPKEGCKQRPPPRYEEPCGKPCISGNPCVGFPHKFRKS